MPTNRKTTTTPVNLADTNPARIKAYSTARLELAHRKLRYAESAMVRREQFSRFAGLTFDGKRNVSEALGYKDTLTPNDFATRFRRGDIANAIVRKLVQDVYRDGFHVKEVVADGADGEKETKFDIAARELFERLKLSYVLREAEIEQRKGHYSAIYIVAPGEDIKTELTSAEVGTPDNIYKLRVFAAKAATIDKSEEDWTSPRFDEPVLYGLTTKGGFKSCHWSRIIHVSEGLDPVGVPILEKVWDRLDDSIKVIGAGAESWWINAVRKILFDLDPEAIVGDADMLEMDDQIDKLSHGLEAYAQTRGVTPKSLPVTLHSFAPDAEYLDRRIAAASDYPHAVLFGNKAGRLAGIEDSADYRKRVRTHTNSNSTDNVKEMTDRLILFGALPSPALGYTVEWPKLEGLDSEGKAKVLSLYANANSKQKVADGTILISGPEIRDEVLDKKPLDDNEQPTAAPSTITSRAAAEDINLIQYLIGDPEKYSWFTTALATAFDIPASAPIDDIPLLVAANLEEELPALLLTAAQLGGGTAEKFTNERGPFITAVSSSSRYADINIVFDPDTFALQQLSATRAGDLITDIAADQRTAISVAFTRGAELGWTQTQIVSSIRGGIGLNTRQVTAVFNMVDRLMIAEPGDIVIYGTPRTVVSIPSTGVTQGLVDQHITAYTERLATYRLDMIGRTEIARMANEGQHEYWRQAVARGDLPVNTYRVFIENTDRHLEFSGETVRVGEPFTYEPGSEPHCGCTQGIELI